MDELWQEWEQWFIAVGETHTTLTILNYYRSPSNRPRSGRPRRCWMLDALYNAAVDLPPSASAGLCIRSGWLTLRQLADYFGISYPVAIDTSVSISITRHEFDSVLARLERSGVPLVNDRDAAWRDFVGWRANYDAIIEQFYDLFTYPRTDWHLATSQPLLKRSNQRGAQ